MFSKKKESSREISEAHHHQWSMLAWGIFTKKRRPPLNCFYKGPVRAPRSYHGAGHVICQNRAPHTCARVATCNEYISSGHFVINSSYPHCVLVPKTAQKVKKMCPFLCPALTPSNGRWLHAFSSEHSKCIFIQALSEVLPKCIKRELLEKSMMSKTFETQLSEKKWERVRWVDRVPLLIE